MNKVEKIQAEIERLKQNNKAFVEFSPYYDGLTDSLDEILSFIDSLEEEPKSDELLEKAAIEAFKQIVDSDKNNFLEIFKAGAQWQKEQDQSAIELAEDHAMLAGMEKMKEEMIDKVCKWLTKHWRKYVWLDDNDVIHFGHWEHDFKRAMEE